MCRLAYSTFIGACTLETISRTSLTIFIPLWGEGLVVIFWTCSHTSRLWGWVIEHEKIICTIEAGRWRITLVTICLAGLASWWYVVIKITNGTLVKATVYRAVDE